MSSQSGIAAEQKLLDSINALDTRYSSLMAVIDQNAGPKIRLEATFKDLETLRDFLHKNENTACYIIIKGDVKFLFVSFTPDYAPVKSKMLYASSKIGFQRQIGVNNLKSYMFTNVQDIDETSWQDSLPENAALTEAELEKIEIDSQQSSIRNAGVKLLSVENGPNSIGFKLNDTGLSTLLGQNNFFVFTVDENMEEINISKMVNLNSPADLVSAIPDSDPSYSLYHFKGNNYFILSCPSGSAVRARMLYATNKKQLLKKLKEHVNIDITKSFEIGDACELDQSEFVEHEAGEDSSAARKNKLSKPKAPSRRR